MRIFLYFQLICSHAILKKPNTWSQIEMFISLCLQIIQKLKLLQPINKIPGKKFTILPLNIFSMSNSSNLNYPYIDSKITQKLLIYRFQMQRMNFGRCIWDHLGVKILTTLFWLHGAHIQKSQNEKKYDSCTAWN